MNKLLRNEAIEIINEFIKKSLVNKVWYKNIKPFVKAIVFYGSTAKGINRVDSDIDIYLITPLNAEEKYTKGEYFYKFKNREINIVLRSIERLRNLAKEKNDFEKEVFRDSEIIWEKDDEVKKLIIMFSQKI